jgi:PAS domain S-box-containing protein/putative nucleotidyltransferase with HDIG domain
MNGSRRLQVAIAIFCLGLVATVWITTMQRVYFEHSLIDATLLTAFILGGGVIVLFALERRKRALEALRESEERFRALVEQSISGIYILQDGVFTYVNQRLAAIGGYEPQELVGKSVLELAPPELRARLQLEMAQRLSGTAKTAHYTLSLRRKDGSPVDVGIHATRAVVDGKPAIMGIMQDVTERNVSEQTARRHEAQLEKALIGAIEAVSTMVELKDPYTAGHQRAVGDIAAAIGQELGLEQEQVKGLRYAGYVHDIGKIAVPAELLSKPGKLTVNEFELIKTHAQQGFDVLKDIKFPWPIARVILEHHERIDGSGYPRGLKGEEISLEARILAVADTVEAMSSHRPYRAALGLEAALREIGEQAGKRYDAQVAAACLQLFQQGKVQLAA